jgi:hypothetical protein
MIYKCKIKLYHMKVEALEATTYYHRKSTSQQDVGALLQ